MKFVIKFSVIFILMIWSCKNLKKEEKIAPFINDYPEEIRELNAEKFYDYSKWLFYLSNYDNDIISCYYTDTVIKERTPPVSLDVKLAWCKLYNDTIDIELCFKKIKDSVFCFNDYNINYYNRFGTVLGSDTVMFRSFQKAKYPTTDDCYADTIQFLEEVDFLRKNGYKSFKEQEDKFIKYLKTTDDDITKWLMDEAIHRGILE